MSLTAICGLATLGAAWPRSHATKRTWILLRIDEQVVDRELSVRTSTGSRRRESTGPILRRVKVQAVWISIVVTVLVALLAAGVVIWQTGRQLRESRRDVSQQITAARVGRLSDIRADTYGQFVTAMELHRNAVENGERKAAVKALRGVVPVLRLVQLRGSAAAYHSATRLYRNAVGFSGLIGPQTRGQVFRVGLRGENRALDAFVALVQRELRQ